MCFMSFIWFVNTFLYFRNISDLLSNSYIKSPRNDLKSKLSMKHQQIPVNHRVCMRFASRKWRAYGPSTHYSWRMKDNGCEGTEDRHLSEAKRTSRKGTPIRWGEERAEWIGVSWRATPLPVPKARHPSEGWSSVGAPGAKPPLDNGERGGGWQAKPGTRRLSCGAGRGAVRPKYEAEQRSGDWSPLLNMMADIGAKPQRSEGVPKGVAKPPHMRSMRMERSDTERGGSLRPTSDVSLRDMHYTLHVAEHSSDERSEELECCGRWNEWGECGVVEWD